MNRCAEFLGAKTLFACILLAVGGLGCGAKILKVDESQKQQLVNIGQYEEVVKVKELPVVDSKAAAGSEQSSTKTSTEPVPKSKQKPQGKTKTKPKTKETKVSKAVQVPAVPQLTRRPPDVETVEGFAGVSRRPIKDPFRVGEKVTIKLSYFGASAGILTMETHPFKEVNGRKSYHFSIGAKSNDFFSRIYTVDDRAETFLDFEDLIPFNYTLSVKETKQLREVRSYFDFTGLKGKFWENKVTKEDGTKTRTLEWDILPFSQNVISAFYYLRIFPVKLGSEIFFRVADEQQKNMIAKATVVRKERISLDAGDFDTLVMKPEIHYEGVFKPMGDILFWLTDDDQRAIIKLEAKIKIGTVVGEAVSIERGQLP